MNLTSELYSYLAQFVNDRRLQLIEEKASLRTRYFSILLENVYQSKNISAVLRTAECMGVQDVHIVENNNAFEYNPYVTRGADKWLTVKRYNEETNNTLAAIRSIKESGYRLIATSPNVKGCSPEELDIDKGKFVVAFGTEWKGLSDIILNEADGFLKIPMVGYTESLNLSVSAGIVMYTLACRLRGSTSCAWQLPEEALSDIKLQWIKTMVKKPDLLVDNFFKLKSLSNN
jgi:tRNA (guanosine-2'-O-)-methyltransferase